MSICTLYRPLPTLVERLASVSFVMTPVWLLEADITPCTLKVWMTLGAYGTWSAVTGTYESIHPAVSSVCERARVSETTFHKAVRDLIAIGALQRIERFDPKTKLQIPNAYRLITGTLVPPSAPVETDTPPPVEVDTPGVVANAPNPEPLTHNQETHKEPAPAPQSPPTKANEMLALLINACTERNVVLPPRVKGMYAKKFKELLDGGVAPELILEALRLSWKKKTLDKVQLLDNFLIEVQAGERQPDVRTKQEVRDEVVTSRIEQAMALVRARGMDPNNGKIVSKAMKEIRLGLVNVSQALTGGMQQMELMSA